MVSYNISRGHPLRIAVGVTMLVLLLAGGAGAATPVSSCGTISLPGEYALNTNLESSSTCISITSNNVIFDGAGYSINGTGVSYTYGIYVNKPSITITNITVKNLKVANWSTGIYYQNVNNGKISNNNASNNYYGISLEYSSNNIVSDNNANSNDEGIYLGSSGNNTVSGNSANSNNNEGIDMRCSSNNIVSGNNANSNSGHGIYLYSSGNNIVSGNKASNNYYGISLEYSNNNTLNGNNASNNSRGISLYYSNNNTLNGNNASNKYYGIDMGYSSNNTLLNNTMTTNLYNFALSGASDSDFNNQIDNSNTVDGKPIYYIKNAKNTVYDSSTNAGTFYCIGCLNVIVKDIKLYKNFAGIFFWNTTLSKIQNVTVSNNNEGIYLGYSSNNMLNGNNASNNLHGIGLEYSSNNNTLSSNNANSNDYYGIYLKYSSNNNALSNNVSNNNYGIVLFSNRDNLIYNNIFNNTNNFLEGNSINTWNIKETPGKNIMGGPNLGGNFWADPTGTGFSQHCTDSDGDGVCDSPYLMDSTNTDYLPLAIPSVITLPPALTSIVVSPLTATLTAGRTRQFNATAKDQYGNPMAGVSISWTSNNLTVGTVAPSNSITGADGNASVAFKALVSGTAMVNAINGSVAGNATVTVNLKMLDTRRSRR